MFGTSRAVGVQYCQMGRISMIARRARDGVGVSRRRVSRARDVLGDRWPGTDRKESATHVGERLSESTLLQVPGMAPGGVRALFSVG